jgi:shikimate kinase
VTDDTTAQPNPNAGLPVVTSVYPTRIVLTGYMGAGKSTVGRRLAAAIGSRFVDTDSWLVRQQNQSISQLFETLGEASFRDLESDALRTVLAFQPIVIATGGGTLANADNLALALEKAVVIYLKASVEHLYDRVIFSPKERPIVNMENSEAVFKQRFEQREIFYNQAPLSVMTEGNNVSLVVQNILEQLKAYQSASQVD